MQVQAQHIGVMTYPIQELDELENVIEASRRMLQTLEHRRDRMLQARSTDPADRGTANTAHQVDFAEGRVQGPNIAGVEFH